MHGSVARSIRGSAISCTDPLLLPGWDPPVDPTDPFDPRTWGQEEREYLIYLSERDASIAAIVDEVDYDWAATFSWGYCTSRLREYTSVEKFYAKRGFRGEDGSRKTVYLHKEILRRAVGEPPSKYHVIGDHRNGNSLDCRRANLRWATPSMNARNLWGLYSRDLFD